MPDAMHHQLGQGELSDPYNGMRTRKRSSANVEIAVGELEVHTADPPKEKRGRGRPRKIRDETIAPKEPAKPQAIAGLGFDMPMMEYTIEEPKRKKLRGPNGVIISGKPQQLAPKRAVSSFLCYRKAVWNQVMNEQANSGLTRDDICKAIGEKWKTLTAEEKRPYEEMAEMDRIRYWREKAQYGHLAPPPPPKKVKPQPDEETRRAMANSIEVNLEVAALLGADFSRPMPPPPPLPEHISHQLAAVQQRSLGGAGAMLPPGAGAALPGLGSLPLGLPTGLPPGISLPGMPSIQGLMPPPMGLQGFGLMGGMMPPNMFGPLPPGLMIPPGLPGLPQAPAGAPAETSQSQIQPMETEH